MQANLSDAAAVPADALIGTLALAGFTFADDARKAEKSATPATSGMCA
jgi:hypothetical protein